MPGYAWLVRRPSHVLTVRPRLVVASLVLASGLLGPHGVGALATAAERASERGVEVDETDFVRAELGGESEDHCPPGCDCPCCGSPVVGAVVASFALGPVGAVTLPATRDGASEAPRGQRADVFRPPRA